MFILKPTNILISAITLRDYLNLGIVFWNQHHSLLPHSCYYPTITLVSFFSIINNFIGNLYLNLQNNAMSNKATIFFPSMMGQPSGKYICTCQRFQFSLITKLIEWISVTKKIHTLPKRLELEAQGTFFLQKIWYMPKLISQNKLIFQFTRHKQIHNTIFLY